MGLAQEDISYIKDHLGTWLKEINFNKPPLVFEMELRERVIRVEEELKHQRDLMNKGFSLMDKRFVEMQKNSDKRFDDMDKRFVEMQKSSDKRFDDIDKRFVEMQKSSDRRFDDMDKRFVEMQKNSDKRFDDVNKRFEAVDKRFESMDRRFEAMQKNTDLHFAQLTRRIDRFMFWSFSLTVAATGTIIAAFKFL